MNFRKIILINISFILLNVLHVKCSDINMTIYYTFPPLYDYDDSDQCLFANPSELSTFCLTDVQIVPKNESNLWRNIENFNTDTKRHFRHDTLLYGVCVHWCENMLEKLNPYERDQLYGGILLNKQLLNYIDDVYAKDDENRAKYNRLINECLNLRFNKKYNLTVTSNIKYCNTNKDSIEIDSWDGAFIFITLIILSLNALSSFYDYHLKRKLPASSQTNEHYKKPITDPRLQLLLSFSVCRNCFRLTKTTNDEPDINKDLRFIDVFKLFMMLGVVSSHSMMIYYSAGIKNPQFIEEFLHRIDKDILINFSGMVQCFFQISGILIVIGLDGVLKKIKNNRKSYATFLLKMIFLRYLRLTPIFAYVVLFGASMLNKLSAGPLWRMVAEREQVFCRRNWWVNLLYIQNYVEVEASCLPQAWYLSVDLQAFVVCLIITMLLYRFPQKMKIIFGVSIMIAIIFPIITVFVYDVPGVYLHTPEYFRHLVNFSAEFKKMYIPLHNNLMGFVFGILTGKIILHLRSKNYSMRDNKVLVWLWYSVIPITFGLIFTCEMYYFFDVPTAVAAIHAALYKLLYAALMTYFFVGISHKIGWMAHEFSILPILRVLGRLTYSVLLIHLYVIFAIYAYIRTPLQHSELSLFIYIFGVVIICYAAGFILTILLELPNSAILKAIFSLPNAEKTTLVLNKNEKNQNYVSALKEKETILQDLIGVK